jgi:hypothetical protein
MRFIELINLVGLDLTSLVAGTYYLNILGGSTNETVAIVRLY